MSLHSYVDSYKNIPMSINNYSGANYQIATNIIKSSSNNSSSSSNFGCSSSDRSDSLQATSSGSYMTHYYYGSGSDNYVRSCRG